MSQKIDYELQQRLKEIKWLRNKCLQNADFLSGQAGGSTCLQLGQTSEKHRNFHSVFLFAKVQVGNEVVTFGQS
jgi:hypothetical protein